MKFKVIGHEATPTRFGEIIQARLESVCGRYTKFSFNNRHSEVGTIVENFNTDAFARVKTRLMKIGIDIEFTGNLPMVYLSKVNGVVVSEIKNAEHGYCIGYVSNPCNLSYRKDLFNKIREIIT